MIKNSRDSNTSQSNYYENLNTSSMQNTSININNHTRAGSNVPLTIRHKKAKSTFQKHTRASINPYEKENRFNVSRQIIEGSENKVAIVSANNIMVTKFTPILTRMKRK